MVIGSNGGFLEVIKGCDNYTITNRGIVVYGVMYYFAELKMIDLNIRLSFPHKIFVAIDKA